MARITVNTSAGPFVLNTGDRDRLTRDEIARRIAAQLQYSNFKVAFSGGLATQFDLLLLRRADRNTWAVDRKVTVYMLP